MAQYHRTGSSGVVITQFSPTPENKRSTWKGLCSYKIEPGLLFPIVTIVPETLELSCPFRFDTTKLPMLTSAKLLRFQGLSIHFSRE